MKLQNKNGETVTGTLTTDHALSRYAVPILVLEDGTAFDSFETFGWLIVDATPDERAELWRAGHRMIELDNVK